METISQTGKYSISIPITGTIPHKSPKSFDDKNLFINRQCGLTINCFDPTKSSPPNLFLKNLELRMSIYNFQKKCE
uniref:Uncharacterized protein n=1 Tax=viral metagenome TaxID=1070528 RepID=A0A6C0IRS8_9ZZZZ